MHSAERQWFYVTHLGTVKVGIHCRAGLRSPLTVTCIAGGLGRVRRVGLQGVGGEGGSACPPSEPCSDSDVRSDSHWTVPGPFSEGTPVCPPPLPPRGPLSADGVTGRGREAVSH